MKKAYCLAAVATLALSPAFALASPTSPFEKGAFLITARATQVSSDADDPIRTAAGAATGLRVDVEHDVMPTLGFTYFVTDHVSVEGILGATQHEIRARGPATDVEVHKTWVLPPIVTLQYRPVTGKMFSPYVGAGVNAMVFFGGKNKNGFDVDLDNALGYALQAGFDAAVTDGWTFNADVKKVFVKTDAKINGGALNSAVHLDPLVVSVGLGRRF